MSVIENTRQASQADDDEVNEIRLSDIIQFLKDSRQTVIIITFITVIIGVLYALNKPNLYTSKVTVLPEIQPKAGGSLAGLGTLAGLAGFNLDNINGTDAIRPDLYPDVLQSVPFGLHMLNQRVYVQELGREMTIKDFLSDTSNKTLIGKLSLYLFKNEPETVLKITPKNSNQTLQLTKQEEEYIKQIQNSVSAFFDKKSGFITVSAVSTDPVVAAGLARLSLEYLTDYITSYRTEKAQKQVTFLGNQVRDAKDRYQSAEYALMNYRDRNRSLFLNTAKIEEQRLQADFILAQTVYNDLSKQLEQAKIRVAEESPVFKTLEPPRVPLVKSGPKRTLMVIGFFALGIFLGFTTYFIRRRLFIKAI